MGLSALCAGGILWAQMASAADQVTAAAPAEKAAAPDAKAAAPAAKVAAPSLKSVAPLRAELHRTVALLIEAEAADKPDAAKVKELRDKIDAIRVKIRSELGAPAFGPPNDRPAGMRGRGGPGPGPGMGPGPGRGGFGRGANREMGYGRGAGWGPHMGAGWGAAYIDEDEDGVCDRYERIHGHAPDAK
jgi:hypothetical protein